MNYKNNENDTINIRSSIEDYTFNNDRSEHKPIYLFMSQFCGITPHSLLGGA